MFISAEDAEELKRTALSDIQKEKELSLLEIQHATQKAQGNIKEHTDNIKQDRVKNGK